MKQNKTCTKIRSILHGVGHFSCSQDSQEKVLHHRGTTLAKQTIDVGADDPVCPKEIPNCAQQKQIQNKETYDVGAGLVSARGITLIALVITIIVLLILAGVAINLVIGENGILNNAKKAGKEYQNAANYEQKLLGDTTNAIDNIISGGNGSSVGETETPPTPPTPTDVETGETHTPTEIQYSWGDIAGIAKIISNNSATITNDTEEVTVQMNGNSYTLGIGDTAVVDEKTVRIIGFNHDELANKSIYGGTNTYAGITFEYVDILTSERMTDDGGFTGGWGTCKLRGTLNSTTLESISIKDYIKEVKKEYIATYNDAKSITTSPDKLWFLSCGEIWDNGYNGGDTRGWAIATEGSQYKYYKKIDASYLGSDALKRSSDTWLRSHNYSTNWQFCRIEMWNGKCEAINMIGYNGVAPGFAI